MPRKRKTDDAKTPEKLMKVYESLPDLEQAIINLLAVFYDSIARSHIIKGLRQLKIKDPKGRYQNLNLLKPYLDGLRKAGFLEFIDGGVQCSFTIADRICIRLVETRKFNKTSAAVRSAVPLKKSYGGGFYPKNYQQFTREIRIGIYQRDTSYVKKIVSKHLAGFYNPFRNEHPYVVIIQNISDSEWLLDHLPQEMLDEMFGVILRDSIHHFTPIPAGFQNLLQEMMLFEADELTESARILLAEYQILQGECEKAEERIEGIETKEAWSVRGFIAFLQGKNDEAIARYETAMTLLKKSTRKRKIFLNDMGGLFYLLALVKSGSHENMTKATGYASIFKKNADERLADAAGPLVKIIKKQQGEPDDPYFDYTGIPYDINASFMVLFKILCFHWARNKNFKNSASLLKDFYKKAGKCGFKWFEAEAMELLSRISAKNDPLKKKAAAFWKKSGIESLADCIKPEPEWRRILNALNRLKQKPSSAGTGASVRMAWLINIDSTYYNWEITPREQRVTKSGKWGKGRRVALRRLKYDIENFDFLTPQDIDICSCIEEHQEATYGYYYNTTYSFSNRAIKALIGHPLVFLEGSGTRVEIVKGEPELCITRAPGGKFKMAFPQKLSSGLRYQAYKETPTRVQVLEVSEEIRQIAKFLDKGITVPKTGKDELLETVGTLSSLVTINSAVGGGVSNAEEVKADPTPRIHLIPYGQGLKISLLVRPFKKAGPYFRPGEGGETLISEIKGQQAQTRRNMKKEKKLADQVVSACPTLAVAADEMGEWTFEEPETCLETLTELQAVGKSAVIAWPEGERFKITRQADIDRFHLRIKKKQDWFSVSGELKLDGGLVMDMQELFALIEKSPGRFIQLDDGQFLALTRSFRKQLDELKAYSGSSGKEARFHPLAALSLNELAGELGGLRGDKHWKAHIKQLQEAQSLQPKIPSTLKAELRDYQSEGFKWLARLSHWGVGACLADDMGLGKTVQALAVILKNAPGGPSMVVAPTSVCMNWQTEAEKFAPTLNLHFLGNGNREKTVKKLKAFDLLIVSYGLLQQEKTAELLSKVLFRTIVLDEAQAIKNFTTKRSKGAMALQGDFRIITTGTPIENNLAELWNLFRFINPGFLGSLSKFNEKFAVPIERDGDKSARQHLKKLIQPFMLRRTKNQVLAELPPRTDVVLPVELSTEEISMYEALRQKAVENLSASDDTAGRKHLQILAEIMKLRRVCCHPRLVLPDADLPGSKLAVFGELAEELLAGNHKALVFSQFVGHLKIIEEFIQKKKIAYQYLDGSTPQKERKKRVDAFQAGEGDFFLISLKAGGLGLNLTAADYVIHMDPWWNPAVEDQASDRTHRIGQKRPVTVYRLVARHTIEEKIVALHQQKRDLADNLLKGADMSGKMSSEELLKLLSEAAG